MKDLPSLEEFSKLAGADKRYEDRFRQIVGVYFDEHPGTPIDAAELTAYCVQARWAGFDSAFQFGETALLWLLDQPGIQLALSRLGFANSPEDEIERMYLRIIERSLLENGSEKPRSRSEGGLLHVLSKPRFNSYIYYMAGLSKAISGYLSQSRVKAAIDGPTSVTRMKALLREFDEIASSSWIAENHQKILKMHAGRAASYFERHDITESPERSRNDSFLPTRLFVTDLYRLHMKIWRKPFKRVIYELSALPFIENPPEDMVSIRRIIQAETARQ